MAILIYLILPMFVSKNKNLKHFYKNGSFHLPIIGYLFYRRYKYHPCGVIEIFGLWNMYVNKAYMMVVNITKAFAFTLEDTLKYRSQAEELKKIVKEIEKLK